MVSAKKVLVNNEVNSNTTEGEGIDTKETENKCRHRSLNKNEEKEPKKDMNTNTEDNPEMLLKMLIEAFKKLCHQMKRSFYFVMVDLGGYQLFDRLAQWCVQHPQLSICLLTACLVALLPILLFVAFALSTIVMTFTGFLVLEGTLLTILTMIMFGLLGAVGIVLLVFALVGFATYFGVSHVYDMYGNIEVQGTNLRKVIKSNDQNLNSQQEQNRTSRDEDVIY